MSLLEGLLGNIAIEGGKLQEALGKDEGHLFDTQPWDAVDVTILPPTQVFQSVQSLIADCQQLIALVQPTKMKLLEDSLINAVTIALLIVAEFSITDKIIDAGGEASLTQLAEACGTNEEKLGFPLRVLTGRHIYVEVSPNVFRNNRHSYELRSGTGGREAVIALAGPTYKAGLGWLPIMKDPKRMHSIDQEDSPFAEVFGKSLVPYMLSEEGRYLQALYDECNDWLVTMTTPRYARQIPWTSIAKTVCDVGCDADFGDVVIELLKLYPDLDLICQNSKDALVLMKNNIVKNGLSHEIQSGRVKFEEHDSSKPQQTAADVYWVRGLLRERTDDECVTLLKHLKDAITNHSRGRIIVVELLFPTILTKPETKNLPASKNLPANQSAYPTTAHVLQFGGQFMVGGTERTFDHYNRLFLEAGLRVGTFYHLKTFTCALELEPIPSNN